MSKLNGAISIGRIERFAARNKIAITGLKTYAIYCNIGR